MNNNEQTAVIINGYRNRDIPSNWQRRNEGKFHIEFKSQNSFSCLLILKRKIENLKPIQDQVLNTRNNKNKYPKITRVEVETGEEVRRGPPHWSGGTTSGIGTLKLLGLEWDSQDFRRIFLKRFRDFVERVALNYTTSSPSSLLFHKRRPLALSHILTLVVLLIRWKQPALFGAFPFWLAVVVVKWKFNTIADNPTRHSFSQSSSIHSVNGFSCGQSAVSYLLVQ